MPSDNLPTICLNMIVKNEEKTILRLLESVANLIDTYCIEDTGSTDNTKAVITSFFSKRGIPGKIVEEPFVDFAYNRTHAIQRASGMSDFLLFLDADMILKQKISTEDVKKKLREFNVFYVLQGCMSFYYKNVRLAKNDPRSRYITPTHEYFAPPDNAGTYGYFSMDELFIDDIGDCGSKSNKIQRDIQLLSKELETNPRNDRCLFYLANTYRDDGNSEKAIEYYKKRVEVGGWVEEVWYSLYQMGYLYVAMKEFDKAIFAWLEAYNRFPQRIENLYEIVKFYRIEGSCNLAYHFFMLANHEKTKNSNWDYVFLQKNVYDFLLDYELSIIGYYCNRDNHDLQDVCMRLLSQPLLEDSLVGNVMMNYKFYSDDLANKYAIPCDNIRVLESIHQTVRDQLPEGFNISTPSICWDAARDELILCIRCVDYYIDENGGYVNRDCIRTRNYLATIDTKREGWVVKKGAQLLEYNQEHDGRYVGLEDVRLFIDASGGLLYNANRGLVGDAMKVEHGWIDRERGRVTTSRLLWFAEGGERMVEKNWVLFQPRATVVAAPTSSAPPLLCVYGWSPLRIGTLKENGEFVVVKEETSVPHFLKHVRGSSNGVQVGDEIWFLCHVVSYEDRRYYYHIMVILDAADWGYKRHSKMFTFKKKAVEYSLGFVYFEPSNSFLIGYSLMDKETEYVMIGKHRF